MTAVSFRMLRGVDGFKMSDVTVGADAPTTNFDFEFRFNVLDSSPGNFNINDFDIIRAIKAMIRWLQTSGGATGGNNYTSITNQPSGPPN